MSWHEELDRERVERGASTTFAYSRSVPPCVWLDVLALSVVGLIVAAIYAGPW